MALGANAQCQTWFKNSLRDQDKSRLEKDITNYGDMPCPREGIKFKTTGGTEYNIHFIKSGSDYIIDKYN